MPPASVQPAGAEWSLPLDALRAHLAAGDDGLDGREAARRLREAGPNEVATRARRGWGILLSRRLGSPLVLILLVAAGVSLATRQWLDASIVLAIVALTSLLSFAQEYRASVAVATLRRQVAPRTWAVRDGRLQEIATADVVPGDVIELSAGALVPADARVLEARACLVAQALLTGEPEPVVKQAGTCAPDAPLAQRDNVLFMGTSLRSGWVRALVVATGPRTTFGRIAATLRQRPPETEFERGLRHFGTLLIRLMLAVVVVVLSVELLQQRPVLDTLLFAAALAVGLSPELLPAILTITLSHGARAMAARGVVVKRLEAIENLGSMDVLCTDKTGTLTHGVLALEGAVDADGAPSGEVLRLAALNAALQAGLRSPLDEAVVAAAPAVPAVARLDEVPYDFERRRLSVVVAEGGGARLITKGAVDGVLAACTRVRAAAGVAALDEGRRAAAQRRFVDWSGQGLRVLAVASRTLGEHRRCSAADEVDLVLEGFLRFADPPDPQAREALASLQALGVETRVVTGDNRHVARHVAEAVGLSAGDLLTGAEIAALNDAALVQRAAGTRLFAEVDPAQKERIVRALRRGGHVVGYLGDGINDAPALHAADVGVSVDQAVDIAKEAADFVLLRHDLDVLRQGIEEGRRTFANTLKYVFIATSANFGNMLSMAVASLALPFLPLLAKQILLNNFLSDVPAMGIAGDRIDVARLRRPHRWDLRTIRRAMLVFGLTSTCFDLLVFAVLLRMAEAPAGFRTGWFVESLLTQVCALLVIRTAQPFWRSRPSGFLLASATAVMAIALALPYVPLAGMLGFVALPGDVLAAVLAVTALFVLATEAGKRWFYRRLDA